MIVLNNKNYNKMISSADKPIIMFFTSNNCPHCDAAEEVLLELKSENIFIFKIKNDKELNEMFKIRAFPTTLTFNKEKTPITKVIGYKSKEYLKLQIKQILKWVKKQNYYF